MEPVRNDTTTDRRTAVELAKRLLVDSIWRTAKIEVDGVTFPDTQEIFDGRAPEGMSVDDIVTVNNIKRAWRFLLDNIDYPVDWQYIREYNRIIGEGLVRDAGRLREYGVRIGGTGWVPEIPTVESPQERVRGILEESEGEDTAMLLFGAVTRGQWFSDGNKRTALMVANHQLIHDGIGVFSIPPEDKAQFVSMLLRYYETGDYSRLSDWLSQNAVGHVPGGLTLAQSSGVAEKTNDAVNGMGIVPGVPLDGLDGHREGRFVVVGVVLHHLGPAAGGDQDRQRRDLQQTHLVGREVTDVALPQRHSGTRHPHEVRQVEQFIDATPGKDLAQRVRTGNEEQFGIGTALGAHVAQRVHGVGVTGTVNIDATHRKPRIGRRRDDGHQVAVLGR